MADRLDGTTAEFRVHIIDVEQGDSILLEGPDGTTMLIDSGHYHDQGKQVLDYLDEHDIDHLDHLVATHYDADHIGSHADIIEAFGSDRIDTVHGPDMEGVKFPDTDTMGKFRSKLNEKDITGNELQEGANLHLGDVNIDVLNPSSDSDSNDINENSVVMQATYGEQSILLAGDVEGEAETQLVDAHAEQLNDMDVLKVAHHGSKFSTGKELMATCEPETVLYSHAEEGKHDHSDTETVTRTTQADKAYSTALHGTTSLTFDGQHDIAIEHTTDTDLHDATDFAALIHYHRDNDVALNEIDSIARSDLPANIPYEIVDNASIIEDSQEVQELRNQLGAKDKVIDAKDEALDAKNQTIDAKDQTIEQLQNENEALSAQEEEIQQLRERLEELEQTSEEQTAHADDQAAPDATERGTTEATAEDNRGQELGNGSQPTDDQSNAAVEEFRSRPNSDTSQNSLGSKMANNPPETDDSSETAHSEDESEDEGHSRGRSR